MVILIGGAAGSGKTELARRLAEGTPVVSLDSLVANESVHQLVRMGYSAQAQPLAALRRAAQAVRPLLELYIADALEGEADLVLETSRLLPEAAAALAHWHGARVRSLFLLEEDPVAVHLHLARQHPVFTTFSPARQRQVVAGQILYGHWLAQEARHLELPLLATQPHQDLAARARRELALLHRDHTPALGDAVLGARAGALAG